MPEFNLTDAQVQAYLDTFAQKYASTYFVFEGLDGSGKTTLQQWLAQNLTDCLCVREPGSTKFSEQIREILLTSEFKLNSLTELFLFMASRTELLHQRIIPALENNQIVLSDRSYISSFAYQAYPGNISVDYFNQTITQIYQSRQIDVLVYFDIPYQVGLQRSASVRDQDNMEAKGNEFYERTARGYALYLEDFISKSDLVELDVSPLSQQAIKVYQHQTTKQYLVNIDAQLSITHIRFAFLEVMAALPFMR
ncbi:dTMP kinase [Psittacicella hinzii]|uniref:Thymidylate kinase n=1 Tax=Psittacicella hinzii TaxID=2028575 RepID=A0A3A1YNJ3_9GAMM|nr:dTMP kinase [Psittacicella hinzii]RIY38540.1 dTMP kinase [Psittacicella hinzii]